MTGWLIKPGRVLPIQNLMEQEVEAMELNCPELEDPESIERRESKGETKTIHDQSAYEKPVG